MDKNIQEHLIKIAQLTQNNGIVATLENCSNNYELYLAGRLLGKALNYNKIGALYDAVEYWYGEALKLSGKLQ